MATEATLDFAKALYWYREAASRGLAPAQYRLATLYELGKGTVADMWINEHWHIAPRFGFAYRWNDRTTVRGGVEHNYRMILAGDAVAEVDRETHAAELRTMARVFADVKSNAEIVAMLAELTPVRS